MPVVRQTPSFSGTSRPKREKSRTGISSTSAPLCPNGPEGFGRGGRSGKQPIRRWREVISCGTWTPAPDRYQWGQTLMSVERTARKTSKIVQLSEPPAWEDRQMWEHRYGRWLCSSVSITGSEDSPRGIPQRNRRRVMNQKVRAYEVIALGVCVQ